MRLTPPTIPVFLIAIVLAILSVASLYTHIPGIHVFVAGHRYWMMVAAFAVMTAGVVLKGL